MALCHSEPFMGRASALTVSDLASVILSLQICTLIGSFPLFHHKSAKVRKKVYEVYEKEGF